MLAAAHDYDLIRAYSTTYQHQASFSAPRYSLAYGNTNPLTASNEELDQVAYHNLLAAKELLRQQDHRSAFNMAHTALRLYLHGDLSSSLLNQELTLCAAEAAVLCPDFDQLERLLAETTCRVLP